MPIEIIMPKVDMDMASGKIMVWHVAEGAPVTKGAPLFDIETDKAAMEVEAPADGILHHAAVEGTEIAIGQPCGWLYAPGEKVGAPPQALASSDEPETAPPDAEPSPAVMEMEAGAQAPDDSGASDVSATKNKAADVSADNNGAAPEKPRATPRARALAREAGLHLSDIQGSGPQGRVQARDVSDMRRMPAPAAPAQFHPQTGSLSVTRSKEGTGTPVVLLHGFASDAQSWAALAKHLRPAPLIRIELPSHGKSPRLAIDSFAALARTVRQAFDDLALDRVHLVGHSLGGAVALALADTRPRTIGTLSLIAPAGLGPEINGTALDGLCRATQPASLAPWLRQLVADETLITDSYARLAMAARADPDLRAAQSALAERLFPDAVQAFDLRAALTRLEMPTRMIWGKRDAVLPWRQALVAPGNVALHLLDGIGHMPQIECPELVARIMAIPR